MHMLHVIGEMFQLAGDPIQIHAANTTRLKIMFDSPYVLTEKEEEAYSMISLSKKA